jgi:hypothetical protein
MQSRAFVCNAVSAATGPSSSERGSSLRMTWPSWQRMASSWLRPPSGSGSRFPAITNRAKSAASTSVGDRRSVIPFAVRCCAASKPVNSPGQKPERASSAPWPWPNASGTQLPAPARQRTTHRSNRAWRPGKQAQTAAGVDVRRTFAPLLLDFASLQRLLDQHFRVKAANVKPKEESADDMATPDTERFTAQQGAEHA